MKFEDCKVVFFSLVSRVDSAIEKSHSQIYVSPLGSIVVSIPACHAGDRSSISLSGGIFHFFLLICFAIQLQASEFTALKR